MNRQHARFRPAFWDDVIEISGWYDKQQPGLGAEFRQELLALVRKVAENPRAYRMIRGEIRRAIVARFQHLVFYEIMGEFIVFLGARTGAGT